MLSSLRSNVTRRLGAIRTKATATPHYPTMKWKKDTIVPKNHSATNADEAYFCGVKPGTPREGWEVLYYGTWAIVTGLAVMVYYSEDTTIQTWAHEEAKVRNIAKENGVDIVYGKWYNKLVVTENVDDEAEFERAEISVGYEFQQESAEEEE